jgi:hypothetical protein
MFLPVHDLQVHSSVIQTITIYVMNYLIRMELSAQVDLSKKPMYKNLLTFPICNPVVCASIGYDSQSAELTIEVFKNYVEAAMLLQSGSMHGAESAPLFYRLATLWESTYLIHGINAQAPQEYLRDSFWVYTSSPVLSLSVHEEHS